mmetsp:Transcript_20755/g.70241  ORF Transcript_20755/g.70241 Transcript_20755/m.70241 type:complete len:212 (-) Transcript_20755:88-723(-)
MLLAEGDQVCHPRHAAVVVDHFAQHARRLQPRQPAEVPRRLGVSVALEHAARSGAQWEDVAGSVEGLRAERRVRESAEGGCALGGGDARRGPRLEVDGHREGGPLWVLVSRDHGRKPQVVAALAGQRDAYHARGVAHDETDCLGRRQLTGEDQVALVLPRLVIGHHDGLTAPHRLDRRDDARAPELARPRALDRGRRQSGGGSDHRRHRGG